MDSRYRIELETEKIQKTLEKLIAIDPDDEQTIDDLWRVQTIRYENAMRMPQNRKGASQCQKRN